MSNLLYDTLFGRHAGSERIFLHLTDGTQVSYKDFLERAAQFANTFNDLGVRTGDRVAVQVEKSPEALALYAACAQAGIVFLPLNTAYTVEELRYFI
ncbi:MAG: AMP-binding protein, partial [Roseibium sp.]|uniref:AMP-binding protein n=1 Tax=Roseibium sp. TaxID=1936156 RepID=UPI00261EEDC9